MYYYYVLLYYCNVLSLKHKKEVTNTAVVLSPKSKHFCEQILHRAPLTAGVSVPFSWIWLWQSKNSTFSGACN